MFTFLSVECKQMLRLHGRDLSQPPNHRLMNYRGYVSERSLPKDQQKANTDPANAYEFDHFYYITGNH